MDLKEIRRENLIFLRDNECNSSLKELSELIGIDEANLSKYWSVNPSTRSGISNITARKIEKRAGKPVIWLDKDHGDPFTSVWSQLTLTQQQDAMLYMKYLKSGCKEWLITHNLPTELHL